MFKKKATNTLARAKENYRHLEEMKRIESPYKIQKQMEKTKRKIAAENRKVKTKTARTIARSSAIATSSTTDSLADAQKAKYDSDQAKNLALISGNIGGENAVDPEKTGSKGVKDSLGTNNVSGFTGW